MLQGIKNCIILFRENDIVLRILRKYSDTNLLYRVVFYRKSVCLLDYLLLK